MNRSPRVEVRVELPQCTAGKTGNPPPRSEIRGAPKRPVRPVRALPCELEHTCGIAHRLKLETGNAAVARVAHLVAARCGPPRRGLHEAPEAPVPRADPREKGLLGLGGLAAVACVAGRTTGTRLCLAPCAPGPHPCAHLRRLLGHEPDHHIGKPGVGADRLRDPDRASRPARVRVPGSHRAGKCRPYMPSPRHEERDDDQLGRVGCVAVRRRPLCPKELRKPRLLVEEGGPNPSKLALCRKSLGHGARRVTG